MCIYPCKARRVSRLFKCPFFGGYNSYRILLALLMHERPFFPFGCFRSLIQFVFFSLLTIHLNVGQKGVPADGKCVVCALWPRFDLFLSFWLFMYVVTFNSCIYCNSIHITLFQYTHIYFIRQKICASNEWRKKEDLIKSIKLFAQLYQRGSAILSSIIATMHSSIEKIKKLNKKRYNNSSVCTLFSSPCHPV